MNGSGLAVLVGPTPTLPVTNVLELYNVADPTNTNAFVTRVFLPAAPSGVALASGIAFVAGGTAGLQVVNYLPFDNLGQAPTVTVSSPVADVDPATPGVQVVEGTSIPITAAVTDDRQVRNVELLVNGQVVRNDVSFPFDLAAIAPNIAPGASTATVQVRATDTGGNVTLSNVLTFGLVEDTVAPQIVSIDPPGSTTRGQGQRTVRIRFTETLNAATVTTATFRLLNGAGQAVPLSNLALRANDQVVQLTFDALTPDTYQVVIDAPNVTDRAGNRLGSTSVVSTFTVQSFTVQWIALSGGAWNNPANWSTGQVPGVNDDVLIDVPGAIATITISGSFAVRSLVSNEAMTLSSGSFVVSNLATIYNAFLISGGTLSGAGTVTVTGLTTWTGGVMSGTGRTVALGGLVISGTGGKTLDARTLENGGVATWSAGLMFFNNGAQFVNRAGAVFDIQGNLSLSWQGGAFASVTNLGTFRKTAGTGTADLAPNIFNNSGTVEVQAGTLRIFRGSSSGAFSIAAGATLAFFESTLATGSLVSGAGNVVFDGNNPNTVAGIYTVSGNTTIQSSVTTNFTGTVSNANITLINDAVATFNGAVSLASLTMNSTGTVSVAGNASTGSLTLSSGTLTGSADLTVTGLTTWTGGVMSGTGRTITLGGMQISGAGGKNLDRRTLENAGLATWTGAVISLTNQATINNLAGAVFDAQSDADFTGGGGGPQPIFNNAGTFRKSAGTGSTFFFPTTFNNSGLVEVLSGSLDVSSGGNSSGSFTVAAGAELSLTNQTLTAASSVTGAGNVTLRGTSTVAGAFNIGGNFTVTGDSDSASFTGATVTIGGNLLVNTGANATFAGAVTAGNVAVSGIPGFFNGNVTFNSTTTITGTLTAVDSGRAFLNGTATLEALVIGNGGTLSGAGTVTVTGLTTWTGGVMSGTGRTITLGGLALSGTGDKVLDTRTLENGGVATWSTGSLRGRNGATLVNRAGATFELHSDNSLTNDQGARPTLNNAGTFRKAAGTGTSTLVTTFNSTGTVEVLSGTLHFTSGYIQMGGATVLNGGSLSSSTINIQGGTLSGSGTINASVVSSGLVSPGGAPGRLTIAGNYTQNAAGSLNIEIGGLTPATEFDQLSVTGTATLNGTLNVTLINGFVPTTGNSFAILTAGSRSGTFATINPPAGVTFNPTYSATGLTLVTQPLRVVGNPTGSLGPNDILTPEALQPLVIEAISRWAAAGIGSEAVDLLTQVEVRIADLPDGFLGFASPTLILIDDDAAGFGWFIDETPWDDAEFQLMPDGELRADGGSSASGRIDLLTVLAHEMGHVLGLDDLDPAGHPGDVMAAVLEPGVRHLPTAADLDLLFALPDWSGTPGK